MMNGVNQISIMGMGLMGASLAARQHSNRGLG